MRFLNYFGFFFWGAIFGGVIMTLVFIYGGCGG